MVSRWLASCCAVLSLAGCQTVNDTYDRMFARGKPAQPAAALVAFTAAVAPSIIWQGSVGSSERDVFYPATAGNVVYAAGAGGRIAGFAAAKGSAVAGIDAGQTLSSGVGAGAGLVLAGTRRGEILAFDSQGRLAWKSQLTGEVLAPPTAEGGVVVARTGDGRIYGLDVATGKRLWTYQRPTQVPLTVRTHAGVIVDGGGAYAGFPGGRLVALSIANGGVRWEGVVSIPRGATELERVSDVASVPAADGQRVCAVAFQGRVACFDRGNGTQLWSRDASSVAGLALGPRYLFFVDEKDAVIALDKSSGASIWKQDKLHGRRVTGPLAFGRYVVVGDYEGYVHLLSREDGAFAGRIATDGSTISVAPLALDLTSFLVQTRNGGVFAISIQ